MVMAKRPWTRTVLRKAHHESSFDMDFALHPTAVSTSSLLISSIHLYQWCITVYCVSRCCIVWMAFTIHNIIIRIHWMRLFSFLLLLLLFGGKSCSNGFLDKMLDDELFDRIICVAELTFSLFHSIEETLWMYLI